MPQRFDQSVEMVEQTQEPSGRTDANGVGSPIAASRGAVDGHHWSPGYDPGGPRLLIHPADLRRRRIRCKPVVERLAKLERTFLPACNICGSDRSAIVSRPDRYGFPARTVMCLDCGLFYLQDRLSDAAYAEFYAGSYRQLTSLFTGGETQTIEDILADQRSYAQRLIQALEGRLNFAPGARLIDVGGSAGQVALPFRNRFNMDVTVLDPAADEIAAARALGLKGIVSPIEEFTTLDSYNLILFCRTIEHVQDLKSTLAKLRRMLTPDGLLYCDIVDFMELCHLAGHPEAATKIDHCFWLTQETAPWIFRSVGLEIVMADVSLRQPLAGFLLRRCEPSTAQRPDPQFAEARLRKLQERASEWQELGRSALDTKDWLRHKAYQLKRRILR